MRGTCISASNVIGKKNDSASTKACQMIAEMVREKHGDQVETDIIPLINYDLRSCQMCGECVGRGHCVYDDGFNEILDRMSQADALFFVVPHYAPIPSKLIILFEKMEEIIYLHYLNDKSYVFPLRRKPAGVVGHGGMPEQYVKHYKTALVDPVASTVRSCGMEVIGVDDEWPTGVAFSITDLRKPDNAIFPIIEHDWAKVRQQIEPLVEKVMAKIV
ncbi:MAG: flavodoxin family protein [Bacillota bacterium]